jgi:nucleoside-diphosphate-sugar epimerase
MRLVTGGTGLLGSYLLCRLFQEKKTARVLKRKNSSFYQLRIAFEFMYPGKQISFEDFIPFFEWKDVDIRDFNDLEESLDGVDEIFHVAALVSFNKNTDKELPDVNLNGTRNLVNLAIKLHIPAFHYVSSIASLNRNEKGIITEEFTAFNSQNSTLYSKSKYLAEMEVWRGYNEGLSGVIINPGIILGTGNIAHGSLVFYNFVKKGLKFYPVGKNGFVDARDVADCLYLLSGDQEKYQNRYLIVSESCYYRDIFSMIAEGFHLKPPSIKIPPALTRIAYYLDSIRSKLSLSDPVLTRDIVRLANSNFEFDTTKVKNSLGFTFRTMESSVKETTNFLINTDFGKKFM